MTNNPLWQALHLLLEFDGELWRVIGLSFATSTIALVVVTPLALLTAYGLSVCNFYGRRALIIFLQGLLSVPTVVIGLVLYILLSRSGVLGFWGILYTPTAIIIGQMIIAFPILVVFILSAFQKRGDHFREMLASLGATRWRRFTAECHDAKFILLSAVIAGFGRVISEVGCALIVGGNIAGHTRTITTAIALDTGRGHFLQGIALGIVLVIMAVVISLLLSFLQGDGKNN